MITNEHQYKITRTQARRFRQALEELEADPPSGPDIHPLAPQVERAAMASMLETLQAEMDEYDHLKSNGPSVIEINSFDDLADGLIKARIAANLSQKDLAGRMGLKEQQIQRYESESYRSASYQRLCEVAAALGLRIEPNILLPIAFRSFDDLVGKLRQVGLKKSFLLNYLLPSRKIPNLSGDVEEVDERALLARASVVLERVFGWTQDDLLGARPLSPPRFAAAEARFRLPAGCRQETTSAYAAYANYLAVTVLKGSRNAPQRNIPADPAEMRKCISGKYGEVSLANTLNTAWDLGVAVLPLKNLGDFHGACWRYERRNVIVLNQASRQKSQWLFDLLHELHHAGQRPDQDAFEIIENDEAEFKGKNFEEEVAASAFANQVMLDGRTEELVKICVRDADGRLENLEAAVSKVAEQHGVDVGALANHIAFRLSRIKINWWREAAGLQADDEDAWRIARDVFLQRFPGEIDDDVDRQLLDRALH